MQYCLFYQLQYYLSYDAHAVLPVVLPLVLPALALEDTFTEEMYIGISSENHWFELTKFDFWF